MDWSRWFRHTFATDGAVRRAFPPAALGRIEAAVDASEQLHSGEIRVAIEGALEPSEIARGKTPRARALEVFAALGVWDTDANNGVLIYVLLADRDVEIVADRGFNGRVAAAEWRAVCENMEREFRAGRFAERSDRRRRAQSAASSARTIRSAPGSVTRTSCPIGRHSFDSSRAEGPGGVDTHGSIRSQPVQRADARDDDGRPARARRLQPLPAGPAATTGRAAEAQARGAARAAHVPVRPGDHRGAR